MPLSVGSPKSDDAIAYVQSGQSPSAVATCEFRHSGAVKIFFESVIPSCLSAFAWFAQSDAVPYGTTMSALVAPAAVSGAVRSLWPWA